MPSLVEGSLTEVFGGEESAVSWVQCIMTDLVTGSPWLVLE